LELAGLIAANSGSEPLVRLWQVRNALLQGCQPQAETFVTIAGAQSADLALLANDLRRVDKPVTKGAQFSGVIAEAGNLKK
jgi:hypothetical protein